jgi:NTP pyrophosphatase (non-canonical NTP hydrolase)
MKPGDSLQQIELEILEFVRVRDWEQFYDAKNLCMAISVEAGELAAVLRWVSNDEANAVVEQPDIRRRLAAEIADIGILLLELCHRTGIPFTDAIREKLMTNEINYPVDSSRGSAERRSE